MSRTVLIVLHHAATDTSLLLDVLAELELQPRLLRLYADEPVPDLDGLLGLIVLGGPMGAFETDHYPILDDSKRLLERAVEREVPTLAICLGAQLLAQLAGGTAFPGAAGREWGFVPVALTDAGRADPVLAGLGGRHFAFHADSFTLPAEVDLLATSPTYPQAFRVASALGLQFHPELSEAGMLRLIGLLDGRAPVEELDRARAEVPARKAATRHSLATLLARWAAPIPSSPVD